MQYTIYCNEPFRMAQKYVQLKPENCLLMKKDELEKYLNYNDSDELIFNINFSILNVKEKRKLLIKDLRKLYSEGKIRKRFNYRLNETSYNLDKNLCEKI